MSNASVSATEKQALTERFNASVWAKLNLTDKQGLSELYKSLAAHYDHYNNIVSGTNKDAVECDLQEIANICTDITIRCKNLIKNLK